MTRPEHRDVLIIGAGAAGLFCALTAGRRGRSVTIIEKGSRVGRKVLISGGGRCNFTNLRVTPSNFLSANPHFCKSALARFTPDDFLVLVRAHGIRFHEKTLGQLFCDDSAKDIVRMLEERCSEAGVKIITGCDVTATRKEKKFITETSAGAFTSDSLVIATGGLTVPKISTDFGYRVAKQFGLNVTEVSPALVPLSWDSSWADLSGVSLDVIASCGKASFRENLLFTHKGLSGPAILQISSHWRPGEKIVVNLTPDHPMEAEFLRAKSRGDRTELKNVLALKFPKRFAEAFCARYFPSKPLDQTSDKTLRGVSVKLSRWEIEPSGSLGYEKAEVTLGGVDTAELSSRTMEASKMPGLFFIGEVVDVTGWLGGYNLHWAWSSGFAAGQAA